MDTLIATKLTQSAETWFSIKVVNFINPHLFYFKLDNGFAEHDTNINGKLEKYIKSAQKFYRSGYAPKLNEMVVAFVMPWNKWIRARVDLIINIMSGPVKYVLWSLDDGVPLLTSNQWLLPMPNEYETLSPSVYLAGLAKCMPIQQTFNYERMQPETILASDWSESAVASVERLFEAAEDIRFLPEFKFHEHLFGKLEITTFAGITTNLATHLTKMDHAKLGSDDILFDLEQLQSIKKKRWENNRGIMNAMNANVSAPEIFQHQPRKSESVVPIDEIDAKVANWTEQYDTDRIKAEIEINRKFQQVIGTLIDYELTNAGVDGIATSQRGYNSFMGLGGTTYKERSSLLSKMTPRKPNFHSSFGKISISSSAAPPTTHHATVEKYIPLFDQRPPSLNHLNRFDSQSNMSDVQSVRSSTTSFFDKKVKFSRIAKALQISPAQPDPFNFGKMMKSTNNTKLQSSSSSKYIPSGFERDVDNFKLYNDF